MQSLQCATSGVKNITANAYGLINANLIAVENPKKYLPSIKLNSSFSLGEHTSLRLSYDR
jgi:hypothetical protein